MGKDGAIFKKQTGKGLSNMQNHHDDYSTVDDQGGSEIDDSSVPQREVQKKVVDNAFLRWYMGLNAAAYRLFVIILFYIITCSFYSNMEKWTIVKSMYFVTVASTSVGYGCTIPTSDESKPSSPQIVCF